MTFELGLEAWRFGKQPYGKGNRERITSEKRVRKPRVFWKHTLTLANIRKKEEMKSYAFLRDSEKWAGFLGRDSAPSY